MSSIGPARYTREFSNMTPAQIRKVLIEGAGTIRNTGEPFEYRIRLLGDSDVDEICRLHRLILNSLPDQLLLYERDSDFFAGCVRGQGCVVGLPRDELPHVAHLAGSSIHPRFRGNGLQLQLLRLRTAFASGAGYYHQCGEVLPGNVISIENHLSCGYFLKGFRVDDFRFDQEGVPHFILHQDTRRQPRRKESVNPLDSSIDDIAIYHQRLEEGLWGFRVFYKARGPRLAFGLFV